MSSSAAPVDQVAIGFDLDYPRGSLTSIVERCGIRKDQVWETIREMRIGCLDRLFGWIERLMTAMLYPTTYIILVNEDLQDWRAKDCHGTEFVKLLAMTIQHPQAGDRTFLVPGKVYMTKFGHEVRPWLLWDGHNHCYWLTTAGSTALPYQYRYMNVPVLDEAVHEPLLR